MLYNWERIDKDKPLLPSNIRILNRFTGLLDEEWFLKTHVIIESEAASVVSAVYDGAKAIAEGNVDKLLVALSWFEQAMSHVASNCLRIMFDREGEDGAVFDKTGMGQAESEDPYDQAVAVVLRDKKASTSYIQRRLQIGYNRAASIMERMENEGIVGPANHAGKREILVETGRAREDED